MKLPISEKRFREAVYSDIEWVSQKPLKYSDPTTTNKRRLGGTDLGLGESSITLLIAHLNLTIRSLGGKDRLAKGALDEKSTVGDAVKKTKALCPKASIS